MGYAHGTRWNDELIKEKVLEVKNALNLDRMPSKQECDIYFNNYALSNAITKRIGWYKLADELGLSMKKSETLLGKFYEKKATKLLKEKGFSVQQMPQNFPYDLLVNDCIKIDVKASHLYKGKTGDFYSFNLEKPFATCDVYLLIALNDNEDIERTMIIPSKFIFKNNQISVGVKHSKYHIFTDRYDYISSLSEYWTNIN